jgi:serine/threonine-protein kinase
VTTTSGGGQRYRFDARIATGGMGEVWRATDLVLGREVAVKLLKVEYAGDPMFRSRFETEARNAAALHHPNVASVFDFGELAEGEGPGGGDPRPYLVMELVRGEPLSALLRGGERMPAETAANLLAQAADGLAAAHDLGIVHRDVKPANLLVTPERVVKITDFGIARATDAVALTRTGQVIGTPQYLAPEQAEGSQTTDATDIYSLGVVLYECLAGRRPFDGDSPIATALAHLRQPPPPLPDDVPPGLRSAVETALAKAPGDRFATMRDFATALRGGAVHTGTSTALPPTVVGDIPTLVQAAPAVLPAAAAATPRELDDAWDRDAGTRGTGTPAAGTRGTGTPAAGTPAAARRPADGGHGDDGSRRGLPGWLPWLLALLAVLAVVFLVTRLVGGNGSGQPSDRPSATDTRSQQASPTPSASASPTRTPSPSQSPTPQQVQVRAGDYVGRNADAARADLEDLGLRVSQRQVDNPGGRREGTVSDVSPTGALDKGAAVTLSVYGPAPESPTPTPTPTPTATPSPSSSPSPSPTPTGGSTKTPGVTTGTSNGASNGSGAADANGGNGASNGDGEGGRTTS